MGDIEWVVLSIFIAFFNDTTNWIIAFALSVLIFNILLEVFHDNSK